MVNTTLSKVRLSPGPHACSVHESDCAEWPPYTGARILGRLAFHRRRGRVLVSGCCCLFWLFFAISAYAPPAQATRLPSELTKAIQAVLPDAQVRLDGSVQDKSGNLFLPVLSANVNSHRGPVTMDEAFPNGRAPKVLVFSDGSCYLRVLKKGLINTVVHPAELPEKARKRLLNGKLPADLIVPDNLLLPRSLKPLIGELQIPTVDDNTANRTDFGQPPKAAHSGIARGIIFLTSPGTGKITKLDTDSLKVTAEYTTEGTPHGMACAGGKLYVTDQAKSRILILDLESLRLLGHVDLPKSAPKGILASPNGQLLYVTESAINCVAVIETTNHRVLLRTKVAAGPARMALTPTGNNLLVLNVPAGQVTVMSTLNQRVLGTVAVGSMPNSIAISSDSQRAYISNRMSNNVAVLDITKRQVVDTIVTGTGPTGVALTQDGTKLMVANAKDNTICLYDLASKQKVNEVKLPLDVDFPGCLLMLPGGKRMLVSSETTDAIGVFDVGKMEFEMQPVIGHNSDEVMWVPLD